MKQMIKFLELDQTTLLNKHEFNIIIIFKMIIIYNQINIL